MAAMWILRSVKLKLLFLALLAVFTITTLVIWSDMVDTKERLITIQNEKSVLLSDTIKQVIMLHMLEHRWRELQGLLQGLLKNNPELKVVKIFHPDNGRIIISTDSHEVGNRISGECWNRFITEDKSPFVVKRAGYIIAALVSPIENAPACHGCHPANEKNRGILVVEITPGMAQKYTEVSIRRHFLGLIIGFVVIGIIFVVGGERLINVPLARLVKAMQKIEEGDLSVRIKEDRKDEFGYLANVFNHMVETIEKAKSKLERTSRLAALGEIISGIAHEIKNYLAGISSALQVIHSELSDDDIKPVVHKILNKINRLDDIVKDLLVYAKPRPPMLRPSKINEVLERCIFFAKPCAEKQHVIIDNRLDGTLPEVMVDPEQMEQVFLNLIINAIHAMPEGGVLTILASEKHYSEMADEIKKSLKAHPGF
jgi:signal transduction histidine kinase